MALTRDILLRRLGTIDGHQPIAAPVLAAEQLYHGGVALLRAGLLVNGAVPQVTDVVIGIVDQVTGGTQAETGIGILGASGNATWVDCATGTFIFTIGSSADALTEADAGATVYYGGEGTNTIIAAKTDGTGTRPVLGKLLPLDPTLPSGMCAVKLTTIGSP